MQVDITKLLTNSLSKLAVSGEVDIPSEYLEHSRIYALKNVTIDGKLSLDEENELVFVANIKGTMILKDDITLSPVPYDFNTDIEETLSSNQYTVDLTDVIWQNIYSEVPSKVHATARENYPSGDGWRVISEEMYDEERNKQNNPLTGLAELLKTKEDK